MRHLLILLTLVCPLLQGASLPSGQNLLPSEGMRAFVASVDPTRGKASIQKTEGKEILHLEVTAPDNINPWDVQASAMIANSVSAGDRILASFWIRGLKSRIESGEVESEFDFELARAPWTKCVIYPIRAGRDWRLIQIPFEASRDYGKAEARMIFRMGYKPETFQISGLSVVNYGKTVKFEELPITQVTYSGREANAPWRQAALERIRKIRMAQILVRVTDANQRPIPGATVSLIQKRNAFHFGSAVSGHYVFKGSDAASREKYENVVRTNFNIATEENALKWGPLAGDWGQDWGPDLALKTANWVRSLGLEFRGHCLIWPNWSNMSKKAGMLKGDPKALRKAVFNHINELAVSMKDLPSQWDVMNEPFDNHDLMDIFGDGIMTEFYQAARKAAPHAELYINDYAILAGGGGDTPHRRHYEKTIQFLVDTKAPLDGIGFQGHFGWTLTSPEDALKILDRYGRFGKKIMVTEYDIDINDLKLAGDYTRDLLILIYSHPAAAGFVTWGFWDGAHWRKNAPFFKMDWSPKPAYKAWEDLVLKQWRTQASGTTGADGRYNSTAHFGDYEIKVSHHGKIVTRMEKLKKEGLDLTIILNK